ncbi:MAG: hypothetical protein GY777_09810 [Candidatus Brocadiaceae bacterium]|nr:hypothetical protein [Candidatus Brocadiaceae bacterium]
MKKIILVFTLSFFVAGCFTTASNIESIDDLKGKKLLVGRFVFFVNGKLVKPKVVPKNAVYNNSKTGTDNTGKEKNKMNTKFSVFLENGKKIKLSCDMQGYVYIQADVGRHYISRIKYHGLILGTQGFRTTNSGINVQNSDTVVNFGTINVDYKRSIKSKVAGFVINAYSQVYQAPAYMSVFQTPDWEQPRNYISSKFKILPNLIRDEPIKFSKEIKQAFD